MQYRKLPKGTEQVSILGIGTSSIQASSEKEIEKIIIAAIENGINNFSLSHHLNVSSLSPLIRKLKANNVMTAHTTKTQIPMTDAIL